MRQEPVSLVMDPPWTITHALSPARTGTHETQPFHRTHSACESQMARFSGGCVRTFELFYGAAREEHRCRDGD